MSVGAERLELQFLQLAVQYYAAARLAALAQLSPVCGNLYHHAIEAFLKARLSQKHTSKDLKRLGGRTGHELPLLWDAFKAEFPNTGLDQFDDTITAVERFERLRYPDAIVAEGAQIIIEWNPSPMLTGQISGNIPPPPIYELVVTDIDRLTAKIFEVCSRNPFFFTSGMSVDAVKAIAANNPLGEKLVNRRLE